MPQKRNPYALAYLRAVSNRLIGLQAGIAAANRVNSAQVDSRLFAYGDVPEAVHTATEAVLLFEECIDELIVNDIRAASHMDDSSICAADLAERLMIATQVSYRDAYRVVGNLINTLETQQRRLADATVCDIVREFQTAGLNSSNIEDDILTTAFDPAACVYARTDIGCAAPFEVKMMADDLAAEILDYLNFFVGAREFRGNAIENLLLTARSFIGSDT